MTGHASDLGSFTLSYLGQTDQITQRQLLNSTLSTSWSYLPNSGDRRLASINNVGLSASQFSNFQFTTTPENFISSITETSDAAAVYPPTTNQLASYNNLNQLTNLAGQSLSYDANGNLLSDGQRTYSWDAESRLVGISYPGQPGKATAFAYDGFGRRTTIASTPSGGGSAITTGYVWCGPQICQARDATNAPTRGYYSEGEFVFGSPTQTYYYGTDQIGTVRRVFASAAASPAYSFDPYGNALQPTIPLTNFGYAGMFYDVGSGLSLTRYRVYDSISSRWASRDPLGELADFHSNLYTYAEQNPLSKVDPDGLQGIPVPFNPNGPFLPYNYAPRLDSQFDSFHNYPFSYDPTIMAYGNLVKNQIDNSRNICYKQWNAQGTANGRMGEFELGVEFPINGNNNLPTVTHRLFKPF